uniref:Uncharacterized protein n=1 Tax=Anguilla anguilla TaxID=7936 RepID=A0A0E9TLI6_ANGAN
MQVLEARKLQCQHSHSAGHLSVLFFFPESRKLFQSLVCFIFLGHILHGKWYPLPNSVTVHCWR